MRVLAENFKGIEYIRISSLPDDQKNRLYKSLNHKLIINILKDDSLMNDCLQYQHYITWYENIYKAIMEEKSVEVPTESPVLTLAFK
jgi:sensor histidine kinase YesM